jgi:polysaccharide export outer membrane protein
MKRILAACLIAGGILPCAAHAGADNEAAVPAVPAASASADNEAAVPAVPVPVATAADPVAKVVEDYHIGASDLLEVSVFQVPELSRVVRVNGRGEITLPLIGQVQAGGLTGQQLETQIAARLQEKYLQDPQVSVFIKEFISQRVTVSGDVNKAGVFPVSGRTTLMQAIAMAGGLGKFGDENDIKVFRDLPNGGREVIDYDLEPIREGKTADPVVHTSDVIVVGRSSGRAALKDVTETLRDISVFGLFF